jgi:hypothetical protein
MAVDPANPDVVYLGTPKNGLFVTFDAGNTWISAATVPPSIDDGYSFSIAFDPNSSTTSGRTNVVTSALQNGPALWSINYANQDREFTGQSLRLPTGT